MENKQTLSEYVYGNLREQILTGYLCCGDPIPSLSQLCETYHVGIRTARDVVQRLKEEGLIRTEERRPSVVIYRQQEGDGNPTAVESVLERRGEIAEVYETMAALLPALLALSVRACGKQAALHSNRSLQRDGKKPLTVRWKAASRPLHSLLDASHNLLFRDAFTCLEIYAKVPFFLECHSDPPLRPAYESYENPMWMLDAVETADLAEIRQRFRVMYRSLADGVRQYLDGLEGGFGSREIAEKRCFFWSAKLGRDHYYMQITRSLIDRIGVGIYRNGTFLPSEAELAAEYGVSVSTIRKSLAMLNRLGFCRTYNVKGTQVTLFNDKATVRSMKNRAHRRDTLLYLSGLQFMALAVKPAALLAFPGIGRDEIEQMRAEVERPRSVLLDTLIHCVMRHMPLEPYRIILQEVTDLLHWGYYYSFYEGGAERNNELNRMAQEALDFLESGQPDAFSRQLSCCYGHALKVVRDSMAGIGLSEAARLITPESD